MHDLVRVRFSEPLADLNSDVEQILQRQWPGTSQERVQRLAIEQLHDDIGRAGGARHRLTSGRQCRVGNRAGRLRESCRYWDG